MVNDDLPNGAWWCPSCGWLVQGPVARCPECDRKRPADADEGRLGGYPAERI